MTGLIIAGMHHSGTSVIARLLADAGWNPGLELMQDDAVTKKQFYEDSDFVELNRRLLSNNSSSRDEPSDWGIAEGVAIHKPYTEQELDKAVEYCANREIASSYWFAKDPRSSLTLDLWGKLPNLKFLIIYRNPWDVVESLMRYGDPFTGRPDWTLSVWNSYNQNLLKSIKQLGSRAMVVAAESVLAKPEEFLQHFSAWTGVPLEKSYSENAIDKKLFRYRPEGSHISRTFQIIHPEVTDLLNQLDNFAKFPRQKIPQSTHVVSVGGGSKKKRAIHVVIACRNDGQFLAESISSVEETAYSVGVPVELTIVDGASDDVPSKKYFQRLNNAGYQIVHVKKIGLSLARNAGARKSKAGVVIPLDADNRLLPPIMVGALKVLNREADIVYGPWQRFGLENTVHNPPEIIDWNAFIPHNTVDACASISRKLLKKLHGWDEQLFSFEDWDLWIRALRKKALFLRLHEATFEYCVRPNSMLWNLAKNPDLLHFAISKVVNRHIRHARKIGVDVSGWKEWNTKN